MRLLSLGLCIGAFLSVASASQLTDRDWVRFDGFERLLHATDVIAIVDFDEYSGSYGFHVEEILYPNESDAVNLFAPYNGAFYGKLIWDFRSGFSSVIIPGRRYLLFLNRAEGGERSRIHFNGEIMLPAYACSYAIASQLHAAVPLFNVDEIKHNSLRKHVFTAASLETTKTLFNRYDKRALLNAFGTLDPTSIVDAVRHVVSIASGSRTLTKDAVPGKLSNNIAFQNIIRDVVKDGKLKGDVLTFPKLPDYAAKEPPARPIDHNFTVIRESYLDSVRIRGFKVNETPFLEALGKLEAEIRKAPNYKNMRFIVSEKLRKEVEASGTKITFESSNAGAGELLSVFIDSMHVEIRPDGTVYIEHL